MPLSFFTSFRSTVTPFLARPWAAALRLLVDPNTGAPTGIQNPNDVGPDGIWVPIDITSAQLDSPPAGMVADLNATYRLNVAPFTRYQSTGSAIVAVSGNNVVPATGIGSNIIVWAPWTVTAADRAIVQGTVHVQTMPA